MKFKFIKILLLFAFLFIIGCEEIPSDIVESKSAEYIVESISSPNEFAYSESNKVLENFITIKNTQSIEKVWFVISNLDGSEEISDLIFMNTKDVTVKKTYSGEYTFDENLLTGIYVIDFYVEDNINPNGTNIKKAAEKKFKFLSNAANLAPVISDLNIPSQIDRNTSFVFSIKVNDPNGLNDVKEVYFELLRPDSSIVYSDANNTNKKFPMFDNGDVSGSGDLTPNDGIFSLKNSFGTSSQTGLWHFTFYAVDKSGSVSNTINFSLKVN